MATVTVILGIIEDDMTLEQLQALIQSAQPRIAAEGLYNIRVSLEYERGYYDDVEVKCSLIGTREETTEERQSRKRQEAENQQRTLSERRKMYEQLKREFEPPA